MGVIMGIKLLIRWEWMSFGIVCFGLKRKSNNIVFVVLKNFFYIE